MNYRGSLALSLTLACTPQPGTTTDNTDPGTTTATTTTPASTGPTTGEPAGLQRCTPTCEFDTDCRIADNDGGFRCLAGVCQLPPCTSDDECRVAQSGWLEPCLTTDECGPGRACILVADAGRCAVLEGGMFMCSDLGLATVERPAFVGGRPTLVCGDDRSTCVDDRCFTPCQADDDCPPQLGRPHCELGTGQCTCSADSECQASGTPGLTACNAGTCGCQVDADCLGGANVDTCVDGACGCSATAACTTPVFDDVIQVCQPA